MSKVAQDKSEIIRQIPRACADEMVAVEFMEKLRWGDTPACPRCGDTDVYKMTARGGERNKRFLWRCRGCARQYTVRIGTVMEESRIPLHVWCYAFWAACASKKGVSALQIKRQTGLSYKSALFLMHRIRWAMKEGTPEPFMGAVEADECYIGGRRKGSRPGRSTDHKTPVFAIIQRGGNARSMVVPNVTGETLKGAIREQVDPSAAIMTDEHASYRGLGRDFAGGHHTVSHKAKEYARGDVHVNTAESYFALLKRGIIGTFHSVSRKHLPRYSDEFQFRWNTRDLDDGARVVQAIRQSEGKRLRYSEPGA